MTNHPPDRHAGLSSCLLCTCIEGSHSALDVVMKVEGLDLDAAKVRAAEMIGRTDLIRNGASQTRRARSDAESLLSPPTEQRDDRLPVVYLAHRLGVTMDAVPLPSTHVVGWKGLPYYDPPPADGAKPTLVGTYPCAVFAMVYAMAALHGLYAYGLRLNDERPQPAVKPAPRKLIVNEGWIGETRDNWM